MPARKYPIGLACKVNGCEAQVTHNGMCKTHSLRVYRHGGTELIREIPTLDKFWKYTKKAGLGECWIWGSGRKKGYGQMSLVVDGKKTKISAHRFSWELHNNKTIPEGLFACHSCNNERCVNPNHIYPGTQKQNMADRLKAGRYLRGDNHPWSRNYVGASI